MTTERPVTPPASASGRAAPLPPRFVIRIFWVAHRAIYSITGGRRGLKHASDTAWGMLRLKTVGRRTGTERIAILGYYEDGPNLVTMAMNGWGAPEPAWWLNLQAAPDTTVELKDGPRAVRAEPRHRRSVHAYGRGGPPTTTNSKAGRPAAPAKRPS